MAKENTNSKNYIFKRVDFSTKGLFSGFPELWQSMCSKSSAWRRRWRRQNSFDVWFLRSPIYRTLDGSVRYELNKLYKNLGRDFAALISAPKPRLSPRLAAPSLGGWRRRWLGACACWKIPLWMRARRAPSLVPDHDAVVQRIPDADPPPGSRCLRVLAVAILKSPFSTLRSFYNLVKLFMTAQSAGILKIKLLKHFYLLAVNTGAFVLFDFCFTPFYLLDISFNSFFVTCITKLTFKFFPIFHVY